MTNKKANIVLKGFIGIVNESKVNGSKLKPNELWFDFEGRELYYKLMQ